MTQASPLHRVPMATRSKQSFASSFCRWRCPWSVCATLTLGSPLQMQGPATVTATEIKLTLSGDYVWRIDRRSGAITMEQPRFGVLGSGQCEIASTVKKF